jgi:four helix bundle suffix protein
VQNIAEGSMASGTSRKTELKLTNVAPASLEELRLDYEDFLRQRGLALWPRDDPRRKALVERRCTNADQVAGWIREIARREGATRQRDGHYGPNGQAGAAPGSIQSLQSKPPLNPAPPPSRHAAYAELSANAALVLIGVTTALLDRQLDAQARAFEQEGGLTERLYRVRSESRRLR